VKLTADALLTTETKTYKLCYMKKSDNMPFCTGTFNVLHCAFDETKAVQLINHNRVYDLTVSFGDLKDQINDNANCWESSSTMPLMYTSTDSVSSYSYDVNSETASDTEIVLKGTDLGVGFTPSYHMTSF
jgi:CDGSH-type Zn-finger protein